MLTRQKLSAKKVSQYLCDCQNRNTQHNSMSISLRRVYIMFPFSSYSGNNYLCDQVKHPKDGSSTPDSTLSRNTTNETNLSVKTASLNVAGSYSSSSYSAIHQTNMSTVAVNYSYEDGNNGFDSTSGL